MCATSLFTWKGVLGSKVPPLPRNVAHFVWAAAWNANLGSVLLKAHFSSKLETLRLQCFLPQKLGSFKDEHFRRAFLRFFKKLKACFLKLFYIFKKINQNCIKTIGS